jgi:hypothetical protein
MIQWDQPRIFISIADLDSRWVDICHKSHYPIHRLSGISPQKPQNMPSTSLDHNVHGSTHRSMLFTHPTRSRTGDDTQNDATHEHNDTLLAIGNTVRSAIS